MAHGGHVEPNLMLSPMVNLQLDQAVEDWLIWRVAFAAEVAQDSIPGDSRPSLGSAGSQRFVGAAQGKRQRQSSLWRINLAVAQAKVLLHQGATGDLSGYMPQGISGLRDHDHTARSTIEPVAGCCHGAVRVPLPNVSNEVALNTLPLRCGTSCPPRRFEHYQKISPGEVLQHRWLGAASRNSDAIARTKFVDANQMLGIVWVDEGLQQWLPSFIAKPFWQHSCCTFLSRHLRALQQQQKQSATVTTAVSFALFIAWQSLLCRLLFLLRLCCLRLG
mmetsp:Transcript_14259/g.33670  ORF Transcript_14259/g.33670 Transcript_14259/m.33670 type:complete len:276 (-) Transcript_14259:946-1773(-)